MDVHARDDASDLMLQRICSEFLEMPGLRLNSRQAQRLWGLDERTCLQLLEFLVDAKFLCQPVRGLYARLTDGPAQYPRLRIVKAALDEMNTQNAKKAV